MKRRGFLKYSVSTLLFVMTQTTAQQDKQTPDSVTLFVAGDVMTGRGIDQVLPHPGNPRIVEPFSRSALDYVELAERANGPIPRPVNFAYIWGDALAVLEAAAPDMRIINLETAITRTGLWVANSQLLPENDNLDSLVPERNLPYPSLP